MAESDGMSAAGGGCFEPVMLRVYNEGHKGATAFFRNRPFLDTFFSALRSVCGDHAKILVHASSIGAEPYSLALWWLHRVLPSLGGGAMIDIAATDIDAGFMAFSQKATYPEGITAGMSREEISWFERAESSLRVPIEARKRVRFLPPMSFVDGDPGEMFDAVLVMNALTYVSAREQSLSIDRWTGYAQHFLAITAFHPDSVKDDLTRCGFSPLMDSHRQIHEAWGDRLAQQAVPVDSPEYTWRLPPYEPTPEDFAFRFGAIFQRLET